MFSSPRGTTSEESAASMVRVSARQRQSSQVACHCVGSIYHRRRVVSRVTRHACHHGFSPGRVFPLGTASWCQSRRHRVRLYNPWRRFALHLERTDLVDGPSKILVDEEGNEWECVDVSPPRGSYATYVCRRRGASDEESPRQISVPRAWDLEDPDVAKRLLRR
jgi:hypothetical protein